MLGGLRICSEAGGVLGVACCSGGIDPEAVWEGTVSSAVFSVGCVSKWRFG